MVYFGPNVVHCMHAGQKGMSIADLDTPPKPCRHYVCWRLVGGRACQQQRSGKAAIVLNHSRLLLVQLVHATSLKAFLQQPIIDVASDENHLTLPFLARPPVTPWNSLYLFMDTLHRPIKASTTLFDRLSAPAACKAQEGYRGVHHSRLTLQAKV